MKNQYKAKIWYYPYIENDVGNRKHRKILIWLQENFKNDDKELWDMIWIKSKHDILMYKPENLYLCFKTYEMAMAFKLRWL